MEEFESLLSIFRANDAVSGELKPHDQHPADRCLVINHQNCPGVFHVHLHVHAAVEPEYRTGTENQNRDPIPNVESTPIRPW